MLRIEKPLSRASEAYDLLREDLIVGNFEPGTRLAIAELQTRYGLGAMPLREALTRLAAEQFVLKYDQRGFAVPPLTTTEFLEIQNARITVETAALRETIAARSQDWEDRLVLAFHHLSKASRGDPDFLMSHVWANSHMEFHKALISGCKNSWLLTFADQLFRQSERYRVRRRQIDSESDKVSKTLLVEHREIMDAAIDGDADTATDRLVEHFRRSLETVAGTRIELFRDPMRFQCQSASDQR